MARTVVPVPVREIEVLSPNGPWFRPSGIRSAPRAVVSPGQTALQALKRTDTVGQCACSGWRRSMRGSAVTAAGPGECHARWRGDGDGRFRVTLADCGGPFGSAGRTARERPAWAGRPGLGLRQRRSQRQVGSSGSCGAVRGAAAAGSGSGRSSPAARPDRVSIRGRLVLQPHFVRGRDGGLAWR